MRLKYTREEIMAENDYARPHEAAGYRLHGGFDEAGRYVTPRTKYRWEAVRNWQKQLTQAKRPLLDASRNLLEADSYPNEEQHAFLISQGEGQTFWDSLTITGIIEARGQALVDFPAPDMQKVIEDDISATAVGHLRKGLLVAHGMDEGGDPAHPEIGAHDRMWFAVRDALFGKDKWPLASPPESISRPIGEREIAAIPSEYEGLILLLTDVLMIEIRAESFFDLCLHLASRPDLYSCPPENVKLAHDLVARIQQDEAIHVAYLRTVISELRFMTFKCADGGRVLGRELIDPVWERMVRWHGREQIELARERTEGQMKERLSGSPVLYAQFAKLAGQKAA